MAILAFHPGILMGLMRELPVGRQRAEAGPFFNQLVGYSGVFFRLFVASGASSRIGRARLNAVGGPGMAVVALEVLLFNMVPVAENGVFSLAGRPHQHQCEKQSACQQHDLSRVSRDMYVFRNHT